MILQNNLILRFRTCGAQLLKRTHHQASGSHAVVIGCFKDNDTSDLRLTASGKSLLNTIGTNIVDLLSLSNFKASPGSCRSFYNLHADFPCITVAGLGDAATEFNSNEGIDESRENIRVGIGAAVKALQKDDFVNVSVDACGVAAAAAEGACLGAYKFDKYKSKKNAAMELKLLDMDSEAVDEQGWLNGQIAAESQNFARELMETPSNYKYPQLFAQNIVGRFSKYTNVETLVRDEAWAEEKKMDCLLSVGRGSQHKSAILELHYHGAGDSSAPVVLVGKGVTFDSGGISIKPSKGMALMRGDMGGAACVLATLEAVVRMNVPVNVTVLAGLVENMPSGSATKPGDVVTAMNSKTVEVDNTDAEGRLVLADLLCYANEFNPRFVINAATLTGAMDVALGAATTGAFTTCDTLWGHLDEAGRATGDRMWRMPLFKYYTRQMECSETADLKNTQKKAGSAGSCTAAAFLKEFVETQHWAHLDIAGVMNDGGGAGYMGAGMSGRPTRTLIEAVTRMSEDC